MSKLEPIAIVGTACRFAGTASSPSKLWEILASPHDKDLRRLVDDRFSTQGFHHRDGTYHGHTNATHAYLLDSDPAYFDSDFFSIKPVEARALDPQQRLLLEIVYEALEAAGLPMLDLRGTDTSVFVGSMVDDYAAMLLRDLDHTPTYAATGSARSILANRISYTFDWHGPSVSLDTACSSSLVAVHMAVQTLRAGESRMALACGSNLILGPENFVTESKLSMLSPDGQSRMWDATANGYARGEGVAAIVLKTLSAALEDGDHIECLIRETAVNQDGATQGITMPSSMAQERLIRQTYAKAGLDIENNPADRCQYFEAHGTGTPAGDPVEAKAIHNVFGSLVNQETASHPLYVGSIKTVFGHTEGTAGLAAIIKASLAIQHGFIPPNLLFNQLSDRVAPFYQNLEIPCAVKPWPRSAVRRASCNSFGFGGTNAHAILESFDKHVDTEATTEAKPPLFTPIVLSAASETSLRANVDQFREFLSSPGAQALSLDDLAWTLRQRRSVLGWRAAVTIPSTPTINNLRIALEAAPDVVRALPSKTNSILGIFTGQGAQWPRMGAELIQQSEVARDLIRELDQHLSGLGSDAPAWCLEAELLANASFSRIHEASFSQPLCTAVQILIVHLLRAAGVRFAAVVGHSSGEIAAAYAAGFLSARDAICIAYFRGYHLAQLYEDQSTSPKQGAMLAVGTSPEDAAELCSDDLFKGRVLVAAVNSATSVTISGDLDAIEELEVILQDEDIFHRRLKVDRAYHSHHVLPLLEPYIASLHRSGISPLKGESCCTWFSSVHSERITVDNATAMKLGGEYWAQNLVQPVYFFQALSLASEASLCDVIVEVGPHPALKGPTTQTIPSVPYHGSLSRGSGDAESLSSLLGFLWSYLSPGTISLDDYERTVSAQREKRFRVIKHLPTYSWNHDTRYWHESRVSKRLRTRPERVHQLLGHPAVHSSPHEMSWNHRLRIAELDWLEGHRVQGQIILPAAGYLCTAVEAGRLVAGAAPIRLIDLRDFVIHQAVAFDQEDDARGGIEILVSLSDIKRTENRVRAQFIYSIARPQRDDNLQLAASATVDVLLGDPDQTLLPTRKSSLSHAIEVDPEPFYAALSDLGYGFTGRFQSLSDLLRKNRRSSCQMRRQRREDETDLLIHPIELDAALQSVMLAHSYPYDQELTVMHLPTSIRHVRVNPACWNGNSFPIDSRISTGDASGIVGQSTIYSASAACHAAVQLSDATFLPLGAARTEDRKVFSKVDWISSNPDGMAAAATATDADTRFIKLLERIAIFYLRQFDRGISADHPRRRESPTSWYLNFARHVIGIVDAGQHKWAEERWRLDTRADLEAASREAGLQNTPDVQIMHLVGTQMPRVFAGETTMIEQFRADGSDILDRYYSGGFGFHESAEWVGRVVKQLVDRYPHLDMLEIGAGTGSATKAVFNKIDDSFKSYTYTDLSPSFFERAGSTFAAQRDRMVFRTLDIGRTPATQGFNPGSYDLVIAYLVLHATPDLELCLANARSLLRPGGFLVVGEGLDAWAGIASGGFIFGPLDGWWLGADTHDNRTLSPHVTATEWDALLRKTNFSGIDTRTPAEFEGIFSKVGFVTQAVDDTVRMLRHPIECPRQQDVVEKLILVGGQTPRTENLIRRLGEIFTSRKLASQVHHFRCLQSCDPHVMDVSSTVLSLSELDVPAFEEITLRNNSEAFEGLRRIFGTGKTLLWVTSGRADTTPFSNMTVGFGRVAQNETPDLILQQLDVIDPDRIQAEVLAEALLRLHYTAVERNTGKVGDRPLWSAEPEITIDEAGRQLLPRIRPIAQVNDRYMSARRPVTRPRLLISDGPAAAAVVLETTANPAGLEKEASVILREFPGQDSFIPSLDDAVAPGSEALFDLQTVVSSSSAVRCGVLGYMFVVLGLQADGTRHLVLSSTLAPRLRVPASSAVPASHHAFDDDEDELIRPALIFSYLLAIEFLRPLKEVEAVLLVHNAPPLLSAALRHQSKIQGIRLILTTESTDCPLINVKDNEVIRLPRFATQSEIDEMLPMLPAMPSAFVGFSSGDSLEGEASLVSALQKQNAALVILKTDALCSKVGSANRPVSPASLGSLLSQAANNVKALDRSNCPTPTVERLEDLVEGTSHIQDLSETTSLINWTMAPQKALPVRISRLDSKPIFKADKTYWVVGMSRALGLALADWMIDAGVKTLVLTSRRPDISEDWLANHTRKGVKVVILPCDVADEAALQAAHVRISSTLPPIAGVIHGAMVLRDTSILKMSFNQMTDVLRPKVQGGLHLDRLFASTNLDFFVLVSSINCVIGNHGQANYAAANTFLCALAGARRKRGLRAATVNGGAILGAGYMQRELARGELDAIVRRYRMMRMSDGDWCQSICEGIDACRLESSVGPELTTSIADVSLDEASAPDAPLWCTNPKFSAFVVVKNDGGSGKGDGAGSNATTALVAERLRLCQSENDTRQVITEAFAAQVRTVLGLDATMSDQELMASASVELGMDSLVSVDLHSWFLRNLQVNVPILTIIGSGRLAELVQHAVDNLAPELLATADGSDERSSAKGSGDGSPSQEEDSVTPASDLDVPASDKSDKPVRRSTTIDWDAETQPPADMVSGDVGGSRSGSQSPATGAVVLTGCTGLLGRHLLQHLLSHPTVEQVHCLAVRNLEQRLEQGVLPSDPRAVYHAGDLGLPRFGLSETVAQSVFDSISAVIHCGADTSHLKNFHAVRASNLGSTVQLARECLRHHLPLYYVSSAGLGMLHWNSKIDGFPAGHIDVPPAQVPDGSEGYLCSKWASEKFLERVSEAYGLRVEIHRPSTIVREGKDAIGDEADKDWVNAFLKYVRMLKAAPESRRNRGFLDLVRVDTVCDRLVGRVLDQSHIIKTVPDGSDVTYFNEVGDEVLALDRLQDIGLGEGEEYQVLPREEWTRRAVAAGLHPGVSALVATMDDIDVNYPRLWKGMSGSRVGENI